MNNSSKLTPDLSKVTFIEGVKNVEDIVHLDEQWVCGSNYSPAAAPGFLFIFDVREKRAELVDIKSIKINPDRKHYPDAPLPDLSALSTHGIDYYPEEKRLYVVNHGGRESIEVFDVVLDSGKPVLSWCGCVVAPENASLNAVVGLRDHQIMTTYIWDHDDKDLYEKIKNGTPMGKILLWSSGKGWKAIPGLEWVCAPNGLIATRDRRLAFSALWGSKKILKIECPASGDDNIFTQIDLDFRPDNLRWAPDMNHFYATGQAAPLEDIFACLGGGGITCKNIPTQVDVICAGTMKKETLIAPGVNEDLVCGTSTIVVNGEYWVSSFKNDCIAVVGVK